ncbi:MAG TPA: hypothetical protein VK750_07545, partial [Cytophagaceae bacterium]|nr:hypothetical protein [Cytophagaceae bacterium]
YSVFRKAITLYNQLKYGDYSWPWTAVAKAFFERLQQDHKIDVLIGEHGPDAGIILANACSKKYRIPWIADFRDPVLWPFRGLFNALYKPVVKKIVSTASATINTNPYWSALDLDLFDIKSHTIVNGYDAEAYEKIPAHEFPSFTVSYFGSFNEGLQEIEPSLEAFLKLLKHVYYSKEIILFYRGLQEQKFLDYCKTAGIPDENLDVKGFVTREETIAFMKGSAVLLIYAVPPHMAKNLYEIKGLYPGKLFEYIGTAKPILSIPTDCGQMEVLMNKEQLGLSTSSVEAAADFLKREYNKWKEKGGSLPIENNNTAKYSRQTQALQLNGILLETIQGKVI